MAQQSGNPRKAKRLALALFIILVGTAVVGYGGLAAWQAYTENDGNSVASGSLQHKNTVGATCTSVTTLPTAGCDVVFNVSGVSPLSPATLATGTVKVSNTGSLNATFKLSTVTTGTTTVATPAGNLCADLNLKVTTLNAGGTETVYNGAMSSSLNGLSLNNNAGAPSATWTSGGATPGGSGASGNTFTFTVTKGAAFDTNSSDQGQSCLGNFQFQQTSA